MRRLPRTARMFDWLVLVVAVVIVLGIAYKVTNGRIDPSATGPENVPATVQLEVYAPEAGMLEHIRVGDRLAEGKDDIDGTVAAVELTPPSADGLVIDQNGVNFAASGQARALVTIDAVLEKSDPTVSLGNQELRVGKLIFLESMLYKFTATVVKVEY
ncbi:MAG TPA: DUF4330 domain-containing protein [Thermoleophilia bacterium]|nr:DUF4330 domain-containing protein [Thermoleophilia bacterium]